jgi:hypothetical protein
MKDTKPQRLSLPTDQEAWVVRHGGRYGIRRHELRERISQTRGRCEWSNAPLYFEASEFGTAKESGVGCHPLYAAIDHSAPGMIEHGFQIVSYALNDIKGHLPLSCFAALKRTHAWKEFMKKWHHQSSINPQDRTAFTLLRRPNT